MISQIVRRVRALLGGARLRRELDDEMAFHIDALTEDLVRGGMARAEARRAAVQRFGSQEAVHARTREERGVALIDETARNLRIGGRSLRRSPLFATTFVVTLALCIASGTAVFSIADAVLWRALPYPAPEQLAHAVLYDPAFGKTPGNTSVDGRTWALIEEEGAPLSRAVYSAWAQGVNLTADAGAAYVQQQRVGFGYFATLGVAPFMGREFTRAEDVPGGPAVAILSFGLWQRTFGSDPDILGRTIRLKGEEHAVVGVMPAGFQTQSGADVFTPLRPSTTGEGSGTNYAVLVRVPDGMAVSEAEARLGSVSVETDGDGERRLGLVLLDDALNAGMRMPLVVLLAGVGLMLAVGMSNLAGLQLARSLARKTELATRHALGGGTSALARQIIVENVILGVLGGATGLVGASLLVRELGRLMVRHFALWQDVSLDGRAIGVAVALTVLATLAFGVAPVSQVARGRIGDSLRSGGRTLGSGAHTMRKVLLVGQVAVVTTMLFAAGLLVRSYGYLDGLDPGFEPDGVLTVQLSLDDARYAEADRVHALFAESLAELESVPQVASAAVALTLPYERALNMPFKLPDEEDSRLTNAVYVTNDFFATLQIPVLSGRSFQDGDRADQPVVAVVNEAFADAAWGGEDPLGRALRMNYGAEDDITVVGVVANVQQSAGWGGDGQPVWETPTIYLPVAQASSGFLRGIHVWFAPSWVVRGMSPETDLSASVSQALLRTASDLPMARMASLDDIIDEAFSSQRFEASFVLAITLFSLLLAGIGLYGIVAHEVLERRAEMGLRMALGAEPSQAIWTAASGGLRLTIMGVLLGGLLSVGLSGVIESLLFGVTARDPIVSVGLVAAMLVFGLAATLVPAARIGRLDAALALRGS